MKGRGLRRGGQSVHYDDSKVQETILPTYLNN